MLPKRYNPTTCEPAWRDQWQATGIYQYDPDSQAPLFAIDTPPPTVSGQLHLGHVYSYSQTDFIARYRRMRGDNIYYPMGFDDNGLPTERLIERQEGLRPGDISRSRFIELCLQVSERAEAEYEALWRRLGLSIDWRHTYRTIDHNARRIAQWSFLDLLAKGLAYRAQAPTIWCATCQTALAQADVGEVERNSEYVTLPFSLPGGAELLIATTRPELLSACVAIFVHPDDERYAELIGQEAHLPLYDRPVPILADAGADPDKGTGAVMCCTFGDSADIDWWRRHNLPLYEAITPAGRMAAGGPLHGLEVARARAKIKTILGEKGLLRALTPTLQTVAVHDRCDTPIEYLLSEQWFINVLDHKTRLMAAADDIEWQPAHMKARYLQWVSNLNWDWCISRQRTFGVPFPIWYCQACGELRPATEAQLPLDPAFTSPLKACAACGGVEYRPDTDMMDTWATSSLSPQIAAALALTDKWPPDPAVLPFALRPQAHEIIRTWTFYTIVKSLYHFDRVPWRTVALSGWGLAPEGEGKISKSRTNNVIGPLAMIERYSADAVRYWAASTGLGKDARIDEAKIKAGAKLVTKLWHVARFSQRFLPQPDRSTQPDGLSLGDRWLLARLNEVVSQATACFDNYEYAAAKAVTERFFWQDLADNYLEMAKGRLYEAGDAAAAWTLRCALETTLKLLAPLLPFVTEQIYSYLFAPSGGSSIHLSCWPETNDACADEAALAAGAQLTNIAALVRRYKSEHNLPLGTPLPALFIAGPSMLVAPLQSGIADLRSITRAQEITIVTQLPEIDFSDDNGAGIEVGIRAQ